MQSEYARQTRWAHDPERVLEEEIPAGSFYVKQLIWVACNECDLQVHAALSNYLVGGVTCPECGTRLASPGVLGNPDVEAARVMQEEAYLRDQIVSEE
jgi:hypothetical protein